MPKIFSKETLRIFEDASANIPIRPLDRAFERAQLRLGNDPNGGVGGARRTQFRRYVAGIDQHDAQQRDKLGAALGALIAESATSKQAYLVAAAERDGFRFADGVFVPADTRPQSFAIASVEDLASLDDRARRLQLLANENPKDAIRGARELVESLQKTVSPLIDESNAGKTADVVRRCLQQLGTVVADLAELRTVSGSPSHARLAVGAAVTFATFVAEMHAKKTEA